MPLAEMSIKPCVTEYWDLTRKPPISTKTSSKHKQKFLPIGLMEASVTYGIKQMMVLFFLFFIHQFFPAPYWSSFEGQVASISSKSATKFFSD